MIVSYVAVVSIGIFTQAAKAQGMITNTQIKPTSIANCSFILNTTHDATYKPEDEIKFVLKTINTKKVLKTNTL